MVSVRRANAVSVGTIAALMQQLGLEPYPSSYGLGVDVQPVRLRFGWLNSGGGIVDAPELSAEQLDAVRKKHGFHTQDDLNSVVQSRLAAEKSKWERNGVVDPAKLKELEDLQKFKADAERAELERKGQYDKALEGVNQSWATKETAWGAETKRLTDIIRQDRVTTALMVAATAHSHAPQQVAQLLAGRIQLDKDFNVTVLAEDGKTPAFHEGKPLSVDQLVVGWLQTNKHFAKPSGTGGGSDAGRGTGDHADLTGIDAKIKAKETELEDAKKKAALPNRSTADLTKVMTAQRELADLQKQKKDGKE